MSKYTGYNETYKKASMKYKKEHRDRIAVDVPKGKKDEYKAFADSRGKSLTALFVELIEREINGNAKD